MILPIMLCLFAEYIDRGAYKSMAEPHPDGVPEPAAAALDVDDCAAARLATPRSTAAEKRMIATDLARRMGLRGSRRSDSQY